MPVIETEAFRRLTPPLRLRYCPFTPTAKQFAFLQMRTREVFYGGAAGGGKAQPLKSTVWTPFGPRPMGEMEVGQSVCTPDGSSAKVLLVHERGTRPVYRVHFADGTSVDCCGEHLWYAWKAGGTFKADRYSEGGEYLRGKIFTTSQLQERVAKGARLLVPVGKAKFTRSFRYPDGAFPVDPYTLGVLLGDGCITNGHRPSICSADPEIPERCEGIWEGTQKLDNGASEYRTWDRSLFERLEAIGLSGHRSYDKFIPWNYKTASEDIRFEVLRGLMDTDGWAGENGRAQYSSTSRELAEDVAFLVRSLGGRAHVGKGGPGRYRDGDGVLHETRFSYGVHVRFVDNSVAFHLERKRSRCEGKLYNGGSPLGKRIIGVEEVGRDEMRCITLDDPRGLYMTDSFTVTHNSIALLMAALQYADVPGYAALILRKTYSDLVLPGALMDVAGQWLAGTDARWNEGKHEWAFPGGGRLVFGYLDGPRDKNRYQSAAFHYIGYDELTHFREGDYLYLFSRARRPESPRGRAPDGTGANEVPIRIRAASNPGGFGHDWVNGRFVTPATRKPGVIFLPAKLTENPYLDQEDYLKQLAELGSVDRARLLEGDWEASDEGAVFSREWFQPTDDTACTRVIRYWDTAATAPSESNSDPDWTVGVLMGRRPDNTYVVLDVQRARLSPGKTDELIQQTTYADGYGVEVWIQEEPGSASKILTHHFAKQLSGFTVRPHRVGKSDGDKSQRAKPWAAALENSLVTYYPSYWIHDFISEHAGFPNRNHDDQVDAASGAHYILSTVDSLRRRTSKPRGQYQVARSISSR